MTETAASAAQNLPATDGPDQVDIGANFSRAEKTGPWQVPARVLVKAVFGECVLDLRDATLLHRRTVIEATVNCGEISIYVPQGIRVSLTGSVAFGTKSSELDDNLAADAPEIEVRCKVRFGSVNVRPVA
jgi:hypothetical protein